MISFLNWYLKWNPFSRLFLVLRAAGGSLSVPSFYLNASCRGDGPQDGLPTTPPRPRAARHRGHPAPVYTAPAAPYGEKRKRSAVTCRRKPRLSEKETPPSLTAQGRLKRGTTLLPPADRRSVQPVTGPAVPPYSRSGGKLREQSFTGFPRRLAAAAGSLKAGRPVFFPIKVVNAFILRTPNRFVKGNLPAGPGFPASEAVLPAKRRTASQWQSGWRCWGPNLPASTWTPPDG